MLRVAHHRFELESGRFIGVSSAGDPIARRLVVFCPPSPGAGMFDPDPLVTAASGVHLVSVDRPGSGSSDPLAIDEAPTIARCADDIGEYLRYSEASARRLSDFEFGKVGVIGWGLGGFVALSVAARFPELVDRAVTVATPSPRSLRRNLRSRRRGILRGDSLTAAESLGGTDDDRALRKPGAELRLQRMVSEGYEQGQAGIVHDLAAMDDDAWARELGRVRATVTLVRGALDDEVASSDGRWYRRRLARARTVAIASAGAFAIISAWDRILGEAGRVT